MGATGAPTHRLAWRPPQAQGTGENGPAPAGALSVLRRVCWRVLWANGDRRQPWWEGSAGAGAAPVLHPAPAMAHDRGVILDVDGTLIDSNDAHAFAWVQAGQALGYDIPFHVVRPLIGMGGDRVTPMVAGVEEDSPEGQELARVRGEIFRSRHLRDLEPTPGARDLLLRLRDDGFERVVASSASEEDLGLLLEQAGVADLIGARTSSGDAEESKPEPDILEAAIARARTDRDRLLMIGDTPYDVEAARRARVPILAVRSGGWGDDDLRGARSVHDHPADILRSYETVILES